MAIELYQGPLDGLKSDTTSEVLFIKYTAIKIAIYYKRDNKYIYYTSALESDLEDITDILLSELETQ